MTLSLNTPYKIRKIANELEVGMVVKFQIKRYKLWSMPIEIIGLYNKVIYFKDSILFRRANQINKIEIISFPENSKHLMMTKVVGSNPTSSFDSSTSGVRGKSQGEFGASPMKTGIVPISRNSKHLSPKEQFKHDLHHAPKRCSIRSVSAPEKLGDVSGSAPEDANISETLCPFTGKKGYVIEEDCHCFCCGTHNYQSPQEKGVDTPLSQPCQGLAPEEEQVSKENELTTGDTRIQKAIKQEREKIKDFIEDSLIRLLNSSETKYEMMQRLDELFLLWSRINNQSFVKSLEEFGIEYKAFDEKDYSILDVLIRENYHKKLNEDKI